MEQLSPLRTGDDGTLRRMYVGRLQRLQSESSDVELPTAEIGALLAVRRVARYGAMQGLRSLVLQQAFQA